MLHGFHLLHLYLLDTQLWFTCTMQHSFISQCHVISHCTNQIFDKYHGVRMEFWFQGNMQIIYNKWWTHFHTRWCTYVEVASSLRLSLSTINTTALFLADFSASRECHWNVCHWRELDSAIAAEFKHTWVCYASMDGTYLRETVLHTATCLRIAKFWASNEWIDRFKTTLLIEICQERKVCWGRICRGQKKITIKRNEGYGPVMYIMPLQI